MAAAARRGVAGEAFFDAWQLTIHYDHASRRRATIVADSGQARVRNDRLSYDDVLRIVELVKSSRFSEFRLKVGEIEVHLRRAGGAAPLAPGTAADAAASPRAQAAAETAARRAEPVAAPGARFIRSPMVGTFYRAPAPDAPPFVEIGQRVEPDTTVCIIEVMKLMNSIAAGTRGVVTDIFVANGEAVEFDQVMIAIRPEGGA